MLGQQKEGESWPSQPVPRHYLKKKAGSQVVSQKKVGFPSIRRENVQQGWPRKEQREGEIKEYSFLIFQSHQATKKQIV